ncbi:hypothetical protein CVT26_004635 [Gymnopilus dilepis]|uniref:Uncharacterized protein n=1 Tax=Gymnopilus dilepis TaxID=231916 RepID=A0A409X6C4_9AGAR|nr:hypothetical protein CVT26_004635 [Gymnopilus dilepis]
MNPNAPYVKKPLPLITPRIEFESTPRPPLPVLTARTEFSATELAVARVAVGPEPTILRRSTEQSRRVAFIDDRSPPILQAAPDLSTPPPSRSVSSSPARQMGGTSMIPQPRGEPGRPNSGGFSILEVLVDNYSWTVEEVQALQDAVDSEVSKKLDTTVSFRSQSRSAIEQICQKMQDREGVWPELGNYQGCWPVVSMIKLRLKSKSESSRKRAERDISRRVIAAAGGRLLNA